MKFSELLKIVADEPVFETGLLLSGEVDPVDVRRQLSRWTSSGKVYQLQRGLYALAPPFQKIKPHPFLIANRMARGSYVSCQSVLAYYGLIPEYVPTVTSVTPGRPERRQTPFGIFEFYHLKSTMLRDYRQVEVAEGQKAFIAVPEKALLDLIYLHPGADSPMYLRELRLQNLELLRPGELQRLAVLIGKPKLQRAATFIAELAAAEASEYETL